MFACIYSQNIPDGVTLQDFAYSFSPLVEETAIDTVVLDVEGCELLFGSAYDLAKVVANRAVKPKQSSGLGCKINVAIAANPDAVIHAARFFEGIPSLLPEKNSRAWVICQSKRSVLNWSVSQMGKRSRQDACAPRRFLLIEGILQIRTRWFQ